MSDGLQLVKFCNDLLFGSVYDEFNLFDSKEFLVHLHKLVRSLLGVFVDQCRLTVPANELSRNKNYRQTRLDRVVMVGEPDILDGITGNHLKVSVLACQVLEYLGEVASVLVSVEIVEQCMFDILDHFGISGDADAWWTSIDEGKVLTAELLLETDLTTALLVLEQLHLLLIFFLDVIY